jgi:hypothetical protein
MSTLQKSLLVVAMFAAIPSTHAGWGDLLNQGADLIQD